MQINKINLAAKLYKEGKIDTGEASTITGLDPENFLLLIKAKGSIISGLEPPQFKKILVCGGAGFIGSNFIRHLMNKYSGYEIINYDKLTYAGNLNNLKDLEDSSNYYFIKGDIADEDTIEKIVASGVDAIVNFAAETHVDRSIHNGSRDFVMTNVVGTQTLLEAARKYNIKKFVQISTDEVYGSLELDEDNFFYEDTAFTPNVPYAAAKAGGDLLCRAYFKTYEVPVAVSHCSNNYGPYQFPEKLIPFFIFNALHDKPLPLYGDGMNVRDWLFVEDHCEAIDLMLHKGVPGEVYNIGGRNEKHNIDIAKIILDILGKPHDLLTFVKDRPGHDRRYAINAAKIKNGLGWVPKHKFEEAMPKTIQWYLDNQEWVNDIFARQKRFNGHISIMV